ncbi:MAG TPA: hypothetical protein VKY65_16100 [Alphaproteobacteria bacterium]|nr:hypothetical protein [Alphaproteobacteria bacterium]
MPPGPLRALLAAWAIVFLFMVGLGVYSVIATAPKSPTTEQIERGTLAVPRESPLFLENQTP